MAHVEDLWTRPDPQRPGGRIRTDRWGKGKRWRARWVEANGDERSRLFPTKAEAQDELARVSVSMASGQYVHHRAGAMTVGTWADSWLATKGHRKATTRNGYDSLVRVWIKPTWGRVPLNRVQHADVQAWITRMSTGGPTGKPLSASRVRQAVGVLSQIMDFAVRAKKIAVNPVHGVELPTIPQSSRTYLTHEQVRLAAAACGDYELLVYLLAYTAIREGEAFNMRKSWIDPLRRRIHIEGSATWVGGRRVEDTTKSHRWRDVPVPAFLAEALAEHIQDLGDDDLVFTAPKGGPMRPSNFLRRVWYPALAEAGLKRITVHELRHTGASLAIAAGADVKVVQTLLGHAEASTTLNVYTHLLEDRLDEVAEALDRERAESQTARRRHAAGGNVIPFRPRTD